MPEYNRNAPIMVLFLLQQIIKSSSTWITNSFIWSSFKVKLSMLTDLCSWRLSFFWIHVTSSDRPFLLCSPATVESGCFEILSPMLLSLFFFYLSILMSIIRDSFLRKKKTHVHISTCMKCITLCAHSIYFTSQKFEVYQLE